MILGKMTLKQQSIVPSIGYYHHYHRHHQSTMTDLCTSDNSLADQAKLLLYSLNHATQL